MLAGHGLRPFYGKGTGEGVRLRLHHNALANWIHPNVPRDRFGIGRATKDVIVKPALPKARRKLVAENEAGALLPLLHKFHHVRVRRFSFYENVRVVRHDAERVHEHIHSRSYLLELGDDDVRASNIPENLAAFFGADGDEVDAFAGVFGTSEPDVLARGDHVRFKICGFFP